MIKILSRGAVEVVLMVTAWRWLLAAAVVPLLVAGPYHQVLGQGCVYPAAVATLGGQLSAAGRSDQYAARHDGFAFFRSVTANPALCAAHIPTAPPGGLALASIHRLSSGWGSPGRLRFRVCVSCR